MKFLIMKNWVGLLGLAIALSAIGSASAQNVRNGIEAMRADLKADRKVVLAEEMNFTPKESEAFWPIYRDYRVEVEKVGDQVVKLVLEYADLYPDVPEERARGMLSQYAKTESNLVAVKRKYYKKMGKVLPATKVFRFAQLDNRFDLGTRVALAGSIPVLAGGPLERAARPK